MYILERECKDADRYSQLIKDWSCKLTILSKKDFFVHFKSFGSKSLLLSREINTGKVVCTGLSPIGYKTLVIPVNNQEFTWFQKTINGQQILVFPKDNLIDLATHVEMDFYYMSIKESVLFKMIDDLGYENCRGFFNGELNSVFLSRKFSNHFSHLANSILNNPKMSSQIIEAQINDIIFKTLNYLEYIQPINLSVSQRWKDLVLKNAIEIIHNEKGTLLTIPQICRMVGASERTLFDAFKDKYHVSPGNYIKAFRLNQVKHDLYKLENLKICEIARKYNFWHMGQFAKDFKNQFGYLPSEIRAKYNG